MVIHQVCTKKRGEQNILLYIYAFIYMEKWVQYNDCESTYLDSGFGQTGLGSQPFASAYTRVVTLVELLFQFVELVRAERGPVTPELWLLGTAATAHTFHVVFATVNAS